MAVTAIAKKTTTALAAGDEVLHDGKYWTVDTVHPLEQAPNPLYDLKLHRVPGRQDDALSEDWADVTASGNEVWDVEITAPTEGLRVITLFANLDANTGIYGDIYTDRGECHENHPGSEILTGFGVLDTSTGMLVTESTDFYDSVTEAQDFIDSRTA